MTMVTVSQSITVISAVPHSTSDSLLGTGSEKVPSLASNNLTSMVFPTSRVSVISSLIAHSRCPFSLNP
jgi:hypothetical protein